MTADKVQLPADGSGKKVRTTTTTVGGDSVHQQVVQLADTTDTIIRPATEDGVLATLNSKVTAVDTDNVKSLAENEVYPQIKLDWDGNDSLIYRGRNTSVSASISDSTWKITQYLYDANLRNTSQKTLTGAWDNREGLAW